jgi:hypothetical protein
MKLLLLRLGFLALFLIATQPAIASNPVIVGEISGVELCAQFACDAAIFTGTCDCIVDNRNTPGFFWVSVQHDPLPNEGSSAAIRGGKWNLTTLRGSFYGRVVDGEIFNTGENTFEITARLRIQKGGNGIVTVSGLLDHNDFPPTFEGDLFQQP